MPHSFVFSLMGPDRSGIVDEISNAVATQKGTWVSSRFIRLAGQFAGVAHITVADDSAEGLAEALRTLDAQKSLTVTFARTDGDAPTDIDTRAVYKLTAMGPDRPGVVHEASHILAEMSVSIDEMTADTEDASMSGGQTFKLAAELRVPDGVDSDDLKDALENALPDFMVDIEA